MTISMSPTSVGKFARLLGLAGLAAIAGTLVAPAPAQAADVLVLCAYEGQTCYAPNAGTVITYGKNGGVKTVVGVTQIDCSNGAFNGDPLKGVNKVCTYVINPDSHTWTQCANEGQKCNFTGAKLVRYGIGSQWVYSSFVNGIDCNNGVFGDPSVGGNKSCQVSN